MTGEAKTLELSGVSAYYNKRRALVEIDVSVPAGGVVALVGPNGAGKTTLLKSIVGLVRTEGSITFGGERIDGLKTRQVVGRGIALAPEGRELFPSLTVRENLEVGALAVRGKGACREDEEWVLTLFPVLAKRAGQVASTLSGGEQQMLTIGRALMSRPQLLLLDEPSLGLAPVIVQQLYKLIARINSDRQMSLLLVEQNTAIALSLASHVYLLDVGHIASEGPSSRFRETDDIRRLFLGTSTQ